MEVLAYGPEYGNGGSGLLNGGEGIPASSAALLDWLAQRSA